jgi:hypothetical protein
MASTNNSIPMPLPAPIAASSRKQSCTDPSLELSNLHQIFVKGVDQLATQDPTQNLITKKPWLDEPSGSEPFDEQATISIPNIGDTAIVFSFKVPIGYDGVVKLLSCNLTVCGFTEGDGSIIWRLFVNNRAVRNFSNILVEKGTIQIPRPISPLRLFSGDIIQWRITNISSALVGGTVCSLNGYIYPSKGMS